MITTLSCGHILLYAHTYSVRMLMVFMRYVMLPVILPYAFALASCAAVVHVVHYLSSHNQYYFLAFLQRLRYRVAGAVFLFSFIMVTIYAFLIFEWIPHNMRTGKYVFAQCMAEQFLHYEPLVLHQPLPQLQLIFSNREPIDNNHYALSNVYIGYKQGDRVNFFYAQRAVLSGLMLQLIDGLCIYAYGSSQYIKSSFKDMIFDIQDFFVTSRQSKTTTFSMKYATWYELLEQPDKQELYKRLGMIVWLYALMLMILFFGPMSVSHNVSWLNVLLQAGGAFCLLYMMSMLGLASGFYGSILLWYFLPALGCLYGWFRYFYMK